MSVHHPLPAPARLSKTGRGLAAAQVLKETATIVLLGIPLVRDEPVVLLSALPGLVLYLLHWQMWRGRVQRRYAAVVWVFTLVDEVWSWLMFQELDDPTRGQVRLMHWSYFLGLAIVAAALGQIGWKLRQGRRQAAGKAAPGA